MVTVQNVTPWFHCIISQSIHSRVSQSIHSRVCRALNCLNGPDIALSLQFCVHQIVPLEK